LQRSILEMQQRQQAILVPFLAEQEGFDVEVDEQGNITSISKTTDPMALKKKEIEERLADRSLAALKGELPVDPALEETLGLQERELRERLSSTLGPGYETSTPGIESLASFNRTAEILRSGARRDELTLAEQLGITREQQRIFQQQTALDVLGQQSQQVPMTLAGAFGQNAQGFGQAQQPFIAQRNAQLQASVANQRSQTALFGAGLGFLGTALFSDRDLKVDHGIIAWTIDGIPVHEFTDWLGERRIGVFAQEAQVVRPDAVYESGGWLLVDYGAI
jgi:hypothetical protein